MKVYIKNKLISIGGSSTVTDENKEVIFKVKGKWLSPTRKKLIYDKDGNLLFIVKNKLINWFVHKAYILDSNKNKIATVKEKYLNLKGEYFISDHPDEIKIEGKFFSLNSQILKNGEVMGSINRAVMSLTDCYELDAKKEDLPFLVALIIAVDNIKDKHTDN